MTLKSKKDWIRGSLITYGFTSKETAAVLSKLRYENQILQLFDYLKPYSKSQNRPSKEEINSEIQAISRRLVKRPRQSYPENIFQAADTHKFSAIKRYVDNGGDINICNKYGLSLLTLFVGSYRPEYTKAEDELDKTISEDDDLFWGRFVPSYLFIPLEERKSGIHKKLEYFFEHGADPNRYVRVDGYAETALMIAVKQDDYYLVKYLLEHGADPTIDHYIYAYRDKDYSMFESMDSLSFDFYYGDRLKINLAIAQLLWEYGLKGWSGTNIIINRRTGVVGGKEAQSELFPNP